MRSAAHVVPPGAGCYLQTRRSCEGPKLSDPLKGKRLKKKSLQIHRTLMNSLVVKVDSKYCPSQLLQFTASVNLQVFLNFFLKRQVVTLSPCSEADEPMLQLLQIHSVEVLKGMR